MQQLHIPKLLTDKSLCGVYRVPAGYLPRLSTEGAAEDVQWHIFPRLRTVIRESLINALDNSLHFPDYFGRNWDAAWDCLSEIKWPAGKLQMLYLSLDADASISENDLRIFVELMNDACRHWAEQSTACYMLIESDRLDSETLNELRMLPS